MPRLQVSLAFVAFALGCGPATDSPAAATTSAELGTDADGRPIEGEGCAASDSMGALAWRCRVSPHVVVQVRTTFAPPDGDGARALQALLVEFEGHALRPRVDTLPFGEHMNRLEPWDVSTADLDGDGWADLRLRHHYGIAANEGHYVWRWMPHARRFAWDGLLSEETNVSNDGVGCVRTFASIGHGGQDQVENRYCLANGAWVEVARREQQWDDDRGGAFERLYERRGGSLVLVHEGEAR